MPTYEFRCPNKHNFERFYRKISDAEAEVHCPECGAKAERLISGGAGLHFKGSGFYITDYGKDGKKDQAMSRPSTSSSESGGSASESKSSGDAKSSSESKPASESKASSSESKSSGTAKGSGGGE
jgi:putative FmdB family regulatory protein